MLSRIHWLLLIAIGHMLLWSGRTMAQEAGATPPAEPAAPAAAPAPAPAPSSPPAAAPPNAAPVREAQPPLWYLKDKDGNLQPVLGWTIEELEELYQLKHGLKQTDQTPRFSLQWLSVTGVAKGSYAELTVQLRILVRDAQGVRVPLRLNQAVLREAVQYKGTGRQSLDFEEGGEGYVVFLRGGADETHELTLRVLVPLSQIGLETRLKLSMPRATSSELKLQVPLADAVARVSDGATLLPPAKAGDGATELSVLGLGGDLELVWRKSGDSAAEVPTVLEAVGAVLAKADSRTIDLEARLKVRGYGGEFDRFRVRLPKGAELTSTNAAGYSFVPVAAEPSAGEAGPLVEVQFPKKTSGEVEVVLTARLSHEAGNLAGWTDLAGFEVVGAVRQWGQIAVSAVGDWHVLWGPSRGVRQVDELPEWLRSEDLVAGFEYFHQPFSLTARVVPRRTRISVEPEYVVSVEATQVRLEAKLKYAIRGAKVFALSVELPNWQLDEVGPDNLVAVDGVAVNPSGVVSIPLVQPSVGQIEITIRAKQPISGQQHALLLELPRPDVSSLGPAAVAVVPDNNVQLTPNAESTVGLLRQQAMPGMSRTQWQQTPLFYRVEGPKAVFAGDIRVRSRAIAVNVATQIGLDDQKAQVEQRLGYTISYEPTDRLTLDVPRALVGSQTLQVLLGDQPVALADVPEQPPAEASATVPKRLVLPADRVRIGPCEVLVRYSVPLEKLQPAASITSAIPLVMPAEGELTGNTLAVISREGIRAQHRDGPWRYWEGSGSQVQRAEGLYLSAPERADQVVLAIHRGPRDPAGSTVVSRAWIQTWLIGDTRQDRAVFRFTSNRKSLTLLMPADVDLGDVELLVDGETVRGQSTPERELIVPLKSDKSPRQHQLEASYHFRKHRPVPGKLEIELPRLGRDVWVWRMYWQLVLPNNEHVVVTPTAFTPEFRWSWNGTFWGRQAVLDQAALDSWAGAQRVKLPATANRYLFSSLGTVSRCELRTANRSLIVLSASGMALVAGLLLIYLPVMRHPAVLLALVVGLAAAVVLYPGPALLAAQAASLGVVLTLLAGLLERSVARRRSVVRESGSSVILERGSTQVQYRPASAGGESVEIAPAPPSAPPSESQP